MVEIPKKRSTYEHKSKHYIFILYSTGQTKQKIHQNRIRIYEVKKVLLNHVFVVVKVSNKNCLNDI